MQDLTLSLPNALARPAPGLTVATVTVTEAARMLGLTAGEVRAFARDGLLAPAGEPGEKTRERRVGFEDLVVLGMAKNLILEGIPATRVRRALRRLRERLPAGETLTGVRLAAHGRSVLAVTPERTGDESAGEGDEARAAASLAWSLESGQAHFPFVACLERDPGDNLVLPAPCETSANGRSADDHYDRGCELEVTSPEQAEDAYRRALALDPDHACAHTNLGRLLHARGELEAAESHYRLALAATDDATTWFNLGVVLEDAARDAEAEHVEARRAYERALELDPGFGDAHYNLARLHERRGERADAFRHLAAYRRRLPG